MTDPDPSAAEVAESLWASGARRAFVVASVHNLRLLKALDAAGIRCIPTSSEVGAGHMADGHARASGELTLLVTSTGPGAGNAVGAHATAVKDGSRVVHLSTTNVVPGAAGLHHVPEQAGWMNSFGSPFVDVTSDGLASLIAALDRGGPAGVTLSWSGATGPLDQPARPAPSQSVTAASEPVSAVQLAPWIEADRPLLFIGGGARSVPAASLVDIAERAGSPVVTSIQGKDLFPAGHELFLGSTLHAKEVREAVADVDVCLAIGSRLTSTSLKNWDFPMGRRIIRTGLTDEAPCVGGVPVEWIPAGSSAVVGALLSALPERCSTRSGVAVATRVRELRSERRSTEGAYGMLDAIASCLSAGDVVVCDMTKLSFWALVALELPDGVNWQFPGLLTMGFGLPAGLGSAHARPDSHVVVIVGDGGLRSVLQELDTARGVPGRVSIILADDDGYHLLRPMLDGPLGVELCESAGPNWKAVIGGMGLRFIDAVDAAGLGRELQTHHSGARVIRVDARVVGEWRDA